MTGFIYVITNTINNKQYVGKTTVDVKTRFNEHCRDYLRFFTEERPLYRAMQKYGIESFSVQMLEECDLAILNEREQYWIDKLNTYKNGYNATVGGDGIQLYDYNLFIQDYDSGMTGNEIAQKYHCDVGTVRKALVKAGRDTYKNSLDRNISIPVIQLDLKNNFIQTFNSSHEAAKWLQENNYTKDKSYRSIGVKVLKAARGERLTAYKFKWRLQ